VYCRYADCAHVGAACQRDSAMGWRVHGATTYARVTHCHSTSRQQRQFLQQFASRDPQLAANQLQRPARGNNTQLPTLHDSSARPTSPESFGVKFRKFTRSAFPEFPYLRMATLLFLIPWRNIVLTGAVTMTMCWWMQLYCTCIRR